MCWKSRWSALCSNTNGHLALQVRVHIIGLYSLVLLLMCCLSGMTDFSIATSWGLQHAKCSTRNHTTVCMCIGTEPCVRWPIFVQFILVGRPLCVTSPQRWPSRRTNSYWMSGVSINGEGAFLPAQLLLLWMHQCSQFIEGINAKPPFLPGIKENAYSLTLI